MGESVNLLDWTRKKREKLQHLKAPAIRDLVPTLKDFSHAVSTRRAGLSVVAEIARATQEEGFLAKAAFDVAEMAQLLVIPAFAEGRLSLSLADSLLLKVPRSVTVLIRGPFATPSEFEPLRGRADGIWIAGPLMRAEDPAAFVRDLVEAAENG